MKVNVFESYDAMSDFVAQEIIRIVADKPTAMISLATGDTPLLAYVKVVSRASEVAWEDVHFVGLDEWIGIPRENSGSCHFFLKRNLFDHLPVKNDNIHLFDALTTDPAEECRKMDDVIFKHGPIDLMIVGIGMNGHVGFNEPGVRTDLGTHVIELDETTKSVGQKYFDSAAPLSKGITLGFRHILAARNVILVANGIHKSGIINAAVNGPVSTAVPASILRNHNDSIFCIDKDAASEL